MSIEAAVAPVATKCATTFLGMCTMTPAGGTEPSIFGFSEFLAALALLVLVYTSTDTLYRFRIAVAPIPIYRLTFIATLIIGGGTLLTDYWFSQAYPVPVWLPGANTIRVLLGAAFLLVVMTWTLFAFIAPPRFNRWNAKRFADNAYGIILRGSEIEQQVLSRELSYSMRRIVQHAPNFRDRYPGQEERKLTGTEIYANTVLLTIGDRRFCRQVARTTPGTAIELFVETVQQRKFDISIGQFYVNITTEALLHKDSLLYHEDHWLRGGLIGHLKPFIRSAYEPFDLVERSEGRHLSPFNIDYRIFNTLDADQFEAYCKIVGVSLKSYVNGGFEKYPHSYALAQAIGRISEGHYGIGQIDGSDPNRYLSIPMSKLHTAAEFIAEALQELDKSESFYVGPDRDRRSTTFQQRDLIDQLAEGTSKLILATTHARGDTDFLWQIYYGAVWGRILGMSAGAARTRIFRRRLFRLLYSEITRLSESPDFKSARILGYCLNILGFHNPGRRGYGRELYPLRMAVNAWMMRNYSALLRDNPVVAASCIFGTIAYDDQRNTVVKTYASSFGREPHREFLRLDD